MTEARRALLPDIDTASIHGSPSDLVQNEVDALRQELTDVKTALKSLMKTVEDLSRVKVEATTPAIFPRAEVKDEPLESQLGDGSAAIPALIRRDGSDNEQREANQEGGDHTEVSGESGNASHDTVNGDEQIVTAPPRRQSTEEPIWSTPPYNGEILFRVNREYPQRIAPGNGVEAEPVWIPTPLETGEETPPPPPRSPSLQLFVRRSTSPIKTIPASPAKRKFDFELVVGPPSKKSKTSRHPVPSPSSSGPKASSSRNVSGKFVAVAKRSKRPYQRNPISIIRKFSGATFNVTLDPKIRDVLVTRAFMGEHFGTLSTRSFNRPPRYRVDCQSYDHFVFVCEDSSPQAPSVPGQPGLVTHLRENAWPELELYRVVARVKRLPSKWQYMGMYKATKLAAWSPAEVRRMPYAVKTHWARKVGNSVWGRPVIARITLRKKLRREPTTAEVEGQVQKLREKRINLPSVSFIVAAFEKGQEKLYPWKLECKGYEEDLQWEIAATAPHYSKEPRKKAVRSAKV